ncbi:MAG: hypothetical protein U0929_03465 [Planctomycetaceae bacterium]
MTEIQASVCPQSVSLLQRVARRMYLTRLGRASYISFLVFSALSLLFVLGVRLTGMLSSAEANWWIPRVFMSVPVLSVFSGLVFARRPALVDSARQVDAVCATNDLFLTVTRLATTAGAYQPLVTQDAEAIAQKITPDRVLSLDPLANPRSSRRVGGALLLATLAGLACLLPTLDPFGKQLVAKEESKIAEQIREAKKATEIRKQSLSDKDSDSEVSEDVQKALEKLVQDLKEMKKAEKASNEKKLNEDQKVIGEQFRNTNNALKDLKKNLDSAQQFGSENTQEMRKMLEGLQQGKPEEMAQKFDEMQEKLERLMKETDPLKRSEMAQQLKKEMDDMSKLAGKKAGSKAMQAALERALDQLQKSEGNQKMSTEALDAAKESMELAKMELKEMAQSARDLQQLEEALETIAKAKKLNSEEQLDGEMAADATTMEEYQELCDQILAKMGGEGRGEGEGEGEGEGDGSGQGEGEGEGGIGGRGLGEGGKAPEDDSTKTAFQTEKTKTAIKKGKILLSMKTKDAPNADIKDLQAEYREIISNIKQATDEAIEKEEAPPGYHEGIKKYFDTLERVQNDSKPDAAAPSAPAAKP